MTTRVREQHPRRRARAGVVGGCPEVEHAGHLRQSCRAERRRQADWYLARPMKNLVGSGEILGRFPS
jgi:hypothetical protein